MRTTFIIPFLLFAFSTFSTFAAEPTSTALSDAYFQQFHLTPAPAPSGLVLKRGDRLAICGDSITEQKKYSRLMEDYLTACVPQLEISVRQFGWGGETVPGFLARMTNDCLRFKPTIATTCYGMNDHHYQPYADWIGDAYRTNTLAMVAAFQAAGTRVILGSPGCIAKIPWWEAGKYQLDDLNLNLCQLRNIDVEIAARKNLGFADMFWPLLTSRAAAMKAYGENYALTGGDGIHPDWAGHLIMAWVFLKSMGLDGNIGTFSVDIKADSMRVSAGHKLVSHRDGDFVIRSSRYPFCPCAPMGLAADWYPTCGSDNITNNDSIRSGMTLVPFNRDFNRMILVATNGTASRYLVSWGDNSKLFTAQQLAQGINLPAEFPQNPFSAAFSFVDAAVAAKQDFETREMKALFRLTGDSQPTMKQIIARTDAVVRPAEKEHAVLEAAVHNAFIPVTYDLKIEAR